MSPTWDCYEPRIFVLVRVLSFHVFCKENSCFFPLLHAHFDVYHYFMILCHFDQMNDIMMFFLSIESILL